jgi:hypothetical protein
MSQEAYDKFTIIKALELVDEDLAIELMSDPDLDKRDLSIILNTGLMGAVVDKKTKKPLKLSNKVMQAGLLNLLKRIDE